MAEYGEFHCPQAASTRKESTSRLYDQDKLSSTPYLVRVECSLGWDGEALIQNNGNGFLQLEGNCVQDNSISDVPVYHIRSTNESHYQGKHNHDLDRDYRDCAMKNI